MDPVYPFESASFLRGEDIWISYGGNPQSVSMPSYYGTIYTLFYKIDKETLE